MTLTDPLFLRRRIEQLEAQLAEAKTIAALLAGHVRYEVIVPDNDPDDVFGYMARCPLCGTTSPGMSSTHKHEEGCPKIIAQQWGKRELKRHDNNTD